MHQIFSGLLLTANTCFPLDAASFTGFVSLQQGELFAAMYITYNVEGVSTSNCLSNHLNVG